MHDIRFIREHPDAFDAGLKRRGLSVEAERLLEVDRRRREAVTRAQELQTRRNELSKTVGQKKSKGEDASAEMAEVARSKDAQAAAEAAGQEEERLLELLLAPIPNLPAPEVPEGPDETANKEARRWGQVRAFDFKAKDHVALGAGLGMMDFETAAKMSGSRFVILSSALARLERALGALMLDLHTGTFGYTEVSPPTLVRDAALFGTGQLP
jgi:seryl-tRNA synthetase